MRAGVLVLGVLGAIVVGCSYPDPTGDALPCTSCDLPARTPKDDPSDAGLTAPAPEPLPADAGKPPSRCTASTPFGVAKLVPGIDSNAHGSSPHLSPDERVIYFTGNDGVSSQVFQAKRGQVDQPFGAAELVPGLNSAVNDNDPTVSSDGLTLVFHSGRSGNNDVWWAKRADVNADFGAPTSVPSIATASYEGQGFFHVATDELWFVSDRGGNYDIFRAKREGATFAAPVAVTELNTPLDDFMPFLSQDGLTIVLSSTRAGGKGGQDLYTATRSAANGTFGAPASIAELNTDVTEQAGSLSPDGCRLYFSRAGGPGGQQLFVAERPLPP